MIKSKRKKISSLKVKSSDDYKDRLGYKEKFISGTDFVELPDFSGIKNVFKPGIKAESPYEIPYYNFGVFLHQKRKFPLFTACNIDGINFRDTSRKDSWRSDPRAKEFSWGKELYTAPKSDFDKGHMVRREYPAWGNDLDTAFKADQDTFHYTNSVPQVHMLNGYTWKELEDNVMHNGAIAAGLKICVFTGPVLDENDPVFVTKVKGSEIQIPNKFWKVIVWKKKGKGLHAVGFVMNQEELLIKNKLVKKPRSKIIKAALANDDVFENFKFKDRKSYQVPVSYIEKISKIKFAWSNVTFPFKEQKAVEMKRIKVLSAKISKADLSGKKNKKYVITNMIL